MQSFWRYLKGSIRHRVKYGGMVVRGHSFCSAQRLGKNEPAREGYRHQWSRCTTAIKHRSGIASVNENRLWNMQLATHVIDGLVLQPDQIFGFWHLVPRPTLANGFRAGPMLVGGQLTTDVGGGLCQISTTLFQALLEANFQILERHNHSIDAHGEQRFFTLGQDAAVVYGYKDLIAKNRSSKTLLLQLEVIPRTSEVTASIWGTAPMPTKVKIESHVLNYLPPICTDGIGGCRVETTRTIQKISPDHQSAPWQINYRSIATYQPHAPNY